MATKAKQFDVLQWWIQDDNIAQVDKHTGEIFEDDAMQCSHCNMIVVEETYGNEGSIARNWKKK